MSLPQPGFRNKKSGWIINMVEKHIVHGSEQISAKVAELGAAITSDYKKILAPGENLLMVGVLNGAFIFMADLARAVDLPVDVDFIRLSSYEQSHVSSTKVTMLRDLEKDVTGRHVLIVEDIVDSGFTLAWLKEYFKDKKTASVRVVVAVDKQVRRQTEANPDYVGFVCHGGFLIGYGLDSAEDYRNLPDIYTVVTSATEEMEDVS